jgi:hypothetical protein
MMRLKPRRVRVAPLIVASLVAILCVVSDSGAAADMSGHTCADNESWDNAMNMCMPSAISSTAQAVVSGQFNAFGVFSVVQGPRGVDQFAAPNMFMIDAGETLGMRQFLNLNLMGTAELWTYPHRGYPELLQIGEERSDSTPYVDAQHPHSSPIMGLTLSETINLDSSRRLRLFFAPRGESTDGPVAFMHRESARDDPDAPLGHHVGQDVGHISSTVLGTQLDLERIIVEASVFNGTEPNPTIVDLPIGSLNSEALRITYTLAPAHRLMASVAHVEQQDSQYPGTTSASRLSASLYDHFAFAGVGAVDQTFIIGSITRHPAGSALTSFLDEAVLQRGVSDFWGRIEVLQRLSSELQIPTPVGSTDEKRWVCALTLGYTHWSDPFAALQIGIGSSLTADVLPDEWSAAYGGRTPLTVRFIVQIRGSGRWQR